MAPGAVSPPSLSGPLCPPAVVIIPAAPRAAHAPRPLLRKTQQHARAYNRVLVRRTRARASSLVDAAAALLTAPTPPPLHLHFLPAAPPSWLGLLLLLLLLVLLLLFLPPLPPSSCSSSLLPPLDDQNKITTLTMLAGENIDYAADVLVRCRGAAAAAAPACLEQAHPAPLQPASQHSHHAWLSSELFVAGRVPAPAAAAAAAAAAAFTPRVAVTINSPRTHARTHLRAHRACCARGWTWRPCRSSSRCSTCGVR
jgi:hypothetical protein